LFTKLKDKVDNIEIVDGFYGETGHTWLQINGFVFDPTAYVLDEFPNINEDKYVETGSFDSLEEREKYA